MKIVDGRGAILGRLASYIAKELLKGEEVIILNCEGVIITGNKKNILKNFEEKRRRVGSGQKGPKYPKTAEKIVKRVVRGMLPKKGRGKTAYKKLKCYDRTPMEFENSKVIEMAKEKKYKFITLKDLLKK